MAVNFIADDFDPVVVPLEAGNAADRDAGVFRARRGQRRRHRRDHLGRKQRDGFLAPPVKRWSLSVSRVSLNTAVPCSDAGPFPW